MAISIGHKTLVFLGFMLLALGLVACGGSSSKPAEDTTQNSAPLIATPTPDVEGTVQARLTEERAVQATIEAKAQSLAKAIVEATVGAMPTNTPLPVVASKEPVVVRLPSTPKPVARSTPAPTPIPTYTPLPTATPLPTPIPGPVLISGNFRVTTLPSLAELFNRDADGKIIMIETRPDACKGAYRFITGGYKPYGLEGREGDYGVMYSDDGSWLGIKSAAICTSVYPPNMETFQSTMGNIRMRVITNRGYGLIVEVDLGRLPGHSLNTCSFTASVHANPGAEINGRNMLKTKTSWLREPKYKASSVFIASSANGENSGFISIQKVDGDGEPVIPLPWYLGYDYILQGVCPVSGAASMRSVPRPTPVPTLISRPTRTAPTPRPVATRAPNPTAIPRPVTAQPTVTQTPTVFELFEDARDDGNKGFYQQAVDKYSELIRRDQSYANVFLNRGYCYEQLGQNEKALEDYSAAIRIDPSFGTAYYNRGNLYLDVKQYQRALEDYNEAIRLDPQYAHAYNNRGFVYENLGQYKKALEDYNETIRLDPQNENAQKGKAIVEAILKGN